MCLCCFFFFNDTATTEIYTLSLHDALPISLRAHVFAFVRAYNFAKHLKALRWRTPFQAVCDAWTKDPTIFKRSEEHTSELQSRQYLVCRLLLEKKNKHETYIKHHPPPTIPT